VYPSLLYKYYYVFVFSMDRGFKHLIIACGKLKHRANSFHQIA
jgi:hypothetical protein